MKKIFKLTVAVLCVVALTACARTNNGVTNNTNATKSSVAITEEKAKEIALERAGLMADEVIFDRVEFDRDDGVDHYEVEFRKDRTEYDADISATDGTFLSWEVDYND